VVTQLLQPETSFVPVTHALWEQLAGVEPQEPLLQERPEQQSVPVLQACPLALQVGAVPHTPLLQERPEQQSVPVLQACPLALQMGAVPHAPLLQVRPEQQSAPVLQLCPEPLQGFLQVPPLHCRPSQHSSVY